MRLDDLLRVSVRQVLRQWRRNLGVVLAIALGIAGLMVVITMGQDVKGNINKDLELLGGATRIKVYFEPLEDYSTSRPLWFQQAAVKALRRLSGVSGVSLAAFKDSIELFTKHHRHSVSLIAVDEYFWEVNSFSPVKGKFFGSEELKKRKKVCVLGEKLAKKLFGEKNTVGSLVNIDNNVYRVIGLLGGMGLGDRVEKVFIPLTTAEDRILRFRQPNHVYVRCHTWDDVNHVAALIPSVVSSHQPAEGLKVTVAWDYLKRVKRMAWWVEFFVYISIAATLLLGGFGIWNIMMANVSSRTREIGLKKAIGAEDRDIMTQFLVEALCLSLGAAVGGIVLGRGSIEILSSVLGNQPSEGLFIFCVCLGVLFAVILGVGAGLAPSLRASRMEVVSAVRYE